MKKFKINSFLIFFYLIINVLSVEILQKDKSIKTDNNYIIFDSSQFAIGDKMYFELDSKGWCSEYLDYQYFDNIDSINYYSELKYDVEKEASSSTTVNGSIKSYTLYFTIKKTENELDGLKGDFLLLEFNCDKSPIEFSNTKTSGKSKIVTIVIIVIVVFFVLIIGIVLLIRYCYKRRITGAVYGVEQNYPYQVNPYYAGQPFPPQYQYGNATIIYQNPNAVMNIPNNVNNNYGAAPQNVPIVQNNEIPSSREDNFVQKYEKPKA